MRTKLIALLVALLFLMPAVSAQDRPGDRFILNAGPMVISCSSDPTAGGGTAATLGTMALCTDGTVWWKHDTADTDWTEVGTGTGGGTTTVYSDGWTAVVATADESLNTSTTLQDDDELFFSVDANTTYLFFARLFVTTGTSTTPDFKFGWTVPSGATMSCEHQNMDQSATTITGTQYFYGSTDGVGNGGVLSTATKPVTPFVTTCVLVVGGTAGTAQFQFAQLVSDGQNTVREAGSFVMFRKAGGGTENLGGPLYKIAEATPTGTGTVTFSNLGTFTHLLIEYTGRSTVGAVSEAVQMRFNGDTGSNYDLQNAAWNNTTGSSGDVHAATSVSVLPYLAGSSTGAGQAGSGSVIIRNYRNTSLWKMGAWDGGYTEGTTTGTFFQRQGEFNWRSTAAITSVTLFLASGNFDTGTIFTVYGIGENAWSTTLDKGAVGGRLTTESGVCKSTSDRTSQGTLYYTPGCSPSGNVIPLYDGSANWRMVTFTELSLTLTSLTSDTNYDAFIDFNDGSPQLVLGAAYTNDTTRSAAIEQQDGVWVLASDHQQRYVGTIRTTSTSTTEDSLAKRYVWNHLNRVRRKMKVTDATSTWSYSTATWRQARATSTNQLDYVVGMADALVEVEVYGMYTLTSTGAPTVGVGIDSTTTNSADLYGSAALTNNYSQHQATYAGTPGLGRHTLVWLEIGGGAGVTWWGNNGNQQAGIQGFLDN